MMKRIALIISSLFVVLGLMGQQYMISFTGSGMGQDLETIEVLNTTSRESILLEAGEILYVVPVVGIYDRLENHESIAVYPNPASDISFIDFNLTKAEDVAISISDVSGRLLLSTKSFLNEGRHIFQLNGLNKGLYFIKLQSKSNSFFGKLIWTGASTSEPVIAYARQAEHADFKSTVTIAQSRNEIGYTPGDRFLFTGKSADFTHIKNLVPTADTTIHFEFYECIDGDNNSYPYVTIGNQVWMAENIRTTKKANGGTITRYCYEHEPENCDNYGGLYTWAQAVAGGSGNAHGVLGICPYGWHLPSQSEMEELKSHVGGQSGNQLKSCRQIGSPLGGDCDTDEHPRWINHPSGNYGTDNFGFSGLPGGMVIYDDWFLYLGSRAYNWSSTSDSPVRGYYMLLDAEVPHATVYHHDKVFFMGVRCLKDIPPVLSLPEVLTAPIEGVRHNYAISGGEVVDDGNAVVYARGVVWSTEAEPDINNNMGFTADGDGLGSFISELTNLSPATTYFVRAYGTNSEGTGYGQTLSFETSLTDLAIITTDEVVYVTSNSAMSGGYISDDGNASITARGVVWGLNPNPDLDTNSGLTNDGTGTGHFVSLLTNLEQFTIYYVRAYAVNSHGVAYGNEFEFLTNSEGVDGELCPGAPTVVDYDGNVYATVKIGNQCWMAENLRSEHEALGNPITRHCYNNDSFYCAIYGGLYSFTTVMNGYGNSNSNPSGVQGICPDLWHVPSPSEFQQLYDYLTTNYPQIDASNIGKKLRSCRQVGSPLGGDCDTEVHPRWDMDSTHYGTDEFNFSALPSGLRVNYDYFVGLGSYSHYWTSYGHSKYGKTWHIGIGLWQSEMEKFLSIGFRCVKD